MEPRRSGGAVPRGPARSSDAVYAGVTVVLLFAVWCAQALEVSVGKVPHIEAMNGSTVLLPCTYSSCFGIKNLYFSWSYNDNGTMVKLCQAVIPAEGVDPNVKLYHDRVGFVGKGHNISILLYNITFEDDGEYICFARNPKEKNRNHSAIYRLYVVDELKVVDKTLTTIIMSVVGGLIGLIVFVMILKALILFALRKMREKKTWRVKEQAVEVNKSLRKMCGRSWYRY
ncbi:sodium channel, voltage-gated, type IV, beta a isoform X2 [Conger conger]|uniref:sodium channel, voltage-gated, type IV, beta a isoform X2 n=1 Tax=Conger conger TaxID=82655 RepID=UPI002A5A808E|nr:sodium channel, voltage-gated, type IV, beta a isoform X2 [Conger conger]